MKNKKRIWKFIGGTLGLTAIACIIPACVVSCGSSSNSNSSSSSSTSSSNTSSSSTTATPTALQSAESDWSIRFDNYVKNQSNFENLVKTDLNYYVSNALPNFNAFTQEYNSLNDADGIFKSFSGDDLFPFSQNFNYEVTMELGPNLQWPYKTDHISEMLISAALNSLTFGANNTFDFSITYTFKRNHIAKDNAIKNVGDKIAKDATTAGDTIKNDTDKVKSDIDNKLHDLKNDLDGDSDSSQDQSTTSTSSSSSTTSSSTTTPDVKKDESGTKVTETITYSNAVISPTLLCNWNDLTSSNVTPYGSWYISNATTLTYQLDNKDPTQISNPTFANPSTTYLNGTSYMATGETVLAQMFAKNYTNTVTNGNDWSNFKYDGLCGFDFAINGNTDAKTTALASISNPNTSLTGLSDIYQTTFAVGLTPGEDTAAWDALQIFFPGI